jgi:transcriptional regulator with GAF, ATPase, and Fis domain
MTRARAWIQAHGVTDELRKEIATALSAADVAIGAEHTGAGIVVFGEVSDALRKTLRNASDGSLVPVAAVAADRAAIRDGGAWELLSAGASDVIVWDRTSPPVEDLAARLERWTAVDDLVASPLVTRNVGGSSRAWRSVLRQIVEVARFTDAPVLLTGESGTGKEIVARLIHALDARPNKGDLVVLDCTTIVPTLSGSEFFGHERGAFTGAVDTRDGAFALADGGTLFLDEVGELELSLQAELLRVVQEGTYKRVGGNTWRRTSFRLICATNRDLAEEQAHNRFRRDFYYRIAGWHCRLPSLRERAEDILPLAERFLRELRPEWEPQLDPLVRDVLLRRDYPGNVRDLRQLVARICVRRVSQGPVTLGAIPEEERPVAAEASWPDETFRHSIRRALALGATLKEVANVAAETAVEIAVEDEDGSLQRAARRLGVTDRALQLRAARRNAN